MRLFGIDIHERPEVTVPVFIVGLIVLGLLAARLARALSGRWLKSRPPVATPIAFAVILGGLHWIPDIGLPGRLGRWLDGTLVIALVLACALVVSRIAVAGVTEYANRHPSLSPAVTVARVSVRLLI